MKRMMKSKYKPTVPDCQSQPGKTFYYVATCILLLLLADNPFRTPVKGFCRYLYKIKRVFKLLFVALLCGFFKYMDKYYQKNAVGYKKNYIILLNGIIIINNFAKQNIMCIFAIV